MYRKYQISPTEVFFLGVVFLIFIGSFLLSLPISIQKPYSVNIVDSIFTSVSSICTTGLVTLNISRVFTKFGQLVILILIQMGGVGFMSILSVIFIFLNKKIDLNSKLILKNNFNIDNIRDIVFLTKTITRYLLIIEIFGAMFLSISIIPKEGISNGIFYCIFHSISACCNAGITIFPQESVTAYRCDILFNLITCGLIILGGLGFIVWIDVVKRFKQKALYKFSFINFLKTLSLHTKMAILVTIILLFLGTLFTFVLEYTNPNTLEVLNLKDKILASFFQSTTLRTAGFFTINPIYMRSSTIILMIILMFIGACPVSTGGGVRTTTIGIIFALIISVLKGKNNTEIFKKNIPISTITRAVSIFFISIVFIVISTFLLSITDLDNNNSSLTKLVFESTSAYGTVGLSTFQTQNLSVYGKLIIIFMMFIGKLGTITLSAIFISKNKSRTHGKIKYPDGDLLM